MSPDSTVSTPPAIAHLDDGGTEPLTFLVVHFAKDTSRKGWQAAYALAFDMTGRVAACLSNDVDNNWKAFQPEHHPFERTPEFDRHTLQVIPFRQRPIAQWERGQPFLGGGGNWGYSLGQFVMARPSPPN